MRRKFERMRKWKKFLLVLLLGCSGWMISACAPYQKHTSLLLDYPAPGPYSYYDNNDGYGPNGYPPAYYGDPFYYGNYYGGYNGYDYNGGYSGSYYGAPSMPGRRMIR